MAHFQLSTLTAAGVLTACWLAAATAGAASDQDLLDVLLENGVLTQQEYDELRATHGEDTTQPPEASERQPRASNLVFGDGGGLKYESTDGEFEFQVGGRVQADGAIYDDDVADLGSGAEIRRARLFASGVLYQNWAFKAQFDFAGSGSAIRDAYLSYVGFENTAITVGNFKEPFSLTNKTSSKYITFTERALAVDAFRPGRRIGASVATHGELWHAAIGGFGNRVSGSPQLDDDGNEQDSGWSVATRATAAPIHGDERLLHVGGSFEYRNPAEAEGVSFSVRPETHVTNVRLADTGSIAGVNDYQIYGLESAAAAGPFSVQGEYLYNTVDGDGDGGDADFDGWYVFGSWFLTGESRVDKYSPTAGKFGRLRPEGPWGAVELALRYSTIDLTDGPIDGGTEDNITAGVNWYVNPYVRLSGNYVNVIEHDRQGVSDEPQAVQFRAQVDF